MNHSKFQTVFTIFCNPHLTYIPIYLTYISCGLPQQTRPKKNMSSTFQFTIKMYHTQLFWRMEIVIWTLIGSFSIDELNLWQAEWNFGKNLINEQLWIQIIVCQILLKFTRKTKETNNNSTYRDVFFQINMASDYDYNIYVLNSICFETATNCISTHIFLTRHSSR